MTAAVRGGVTLWLQDTATPEDQHGRQRSEPDHPYDEYEEGCPSDDYGSGHDSDDADVSDYFSVKFSRVT